MGGQFLSKPKRDGPGECDTDDAMGLSYGVIGVQGWRLSMEDSHIAIPRLKTFLESEDNCCTIDKSRREQLIANLPECSLFAVFDGHGGEEVSKLCSRKFVDFLVNDDSFVCGDYEKCLHDVYMKLDDYIKSPEGQEQLQQVIDEKENEQVTADEDDEDEEDLSDEGSLGEDDEEFDEDLDDEDGVNENGDENEAEHDEDDEGGESSSHAATGALLNSLMNSEFLGFLAKRTQRMRDELNALGDDEDDDEEFDPEDVTESDEDEAESDEDENDDEEENNEHEDKKVDEDKESKEETTSSNIEKGATSKSDEIKNDADASNTEVKGQDKTDTSSEEADHNKESNKLKRNMIEEEEKEEGSAQGDTKEDASKSSDQIMCKKSRKAAAPKKLKAKTDTETKDADQINGHGEESKENGESDDDDDDCDEEDDDENESHFSQQTDSLLEKPGFDSGCTAVVALKVASKVYVANAGDSRCILCRDGSVEALSFDHNPSDAREVDRVVNAGGKIEMGRVDGGLNLTRAIGDHRYKQNAELPAEKQRITCEPEVTVTELTSAHSANGHDSPPRDFLVLACDGVWECLQNQQVADFVNEKLVAQKQNLFEICQQLSEECIAASAHGAQSTGLDNVTALIVTLSPHSLTKKYTHPYPHPRQTNSSSEKCEKSKKDTINGDVTPLSKETLSESSTNEAKGVHVNALNGHQSTDSSDVITNGDESEPQRKDDLKRKRLDDESTQDEPIAAVDSRGDCVSSDDVIKECKVARTSDH